MKNALIVFFLILILILNTSISHAGWLIYHKPEFKGKVIDAETKEPIEGAVVVVIYNKHSLISGPGGGYSSVIKVKEILTDKNGEFYFSSYTTLIQPNSIEDNVEVIIYKPGYGSYPGLQINPPLPVDPEFFFTREFGKTDAVRIDNKTYTYIRGLIELPKLKTREEWLTSPSIPADVGSKEAPILYSLLNEVRKKYGLGEVK